MALLSELLSGLNYEVLQAGDPQIKGLAYDSREVEDGFLFFALPGTHTDGIRFLAEAQRRGARAALVQTTPESLPPGLALVKVADVRWAMSALSDRFYGHPSHELKVIGVTGTDGKSSTVSFIVQLLDSVGHHCGYFSTVEYRDGHQALPNTFRQSTPEAPQIHGMLRTMVQNGLKYAVLESTSHGLSLKTARLAHVRYAVAVFTNVTVEHLDFHGTVEQYRRDKARLFEALDQNPDVAFGVVNKDDPNHQLYIQSTHRPVFTYSLRDSQTDLWAANIQESVDGLSFDLMPLNQRVWLPLVGTYNVSNVLAALLAASRVTVMEVSTFLGALPTLRAPRGRMQRIKANQPFEVIIDYAHTPGSFEVVLPNLKATTSGRLIVVFGSAGERDHVKRPLQGEVADRFSDIIVLTDEDPRLEDPEQILDEIQVGIKNKTLNRNLFRVRPRREAIAFALKLAQSGDRVVFLGKGHESSLISTTKEAWDEAQEVLSALKRMGYESA